MREYPYLDSLGIELECAIPEDSYNDFLHWARSKFDGRFVASTDGSVGGSRKPNYMTKREFKFWSKDLKELDEFLDGAYNTYGVVTDKSCGFHIHFKPDTNKIDYDVFRAAIAHKKYQDMFLNAYRKRYHGNRRYMARITPIDDDVDWAYEGLGTDSSGRINWENITANARRQLIGRGSKFTPFNLQPNRKKTTELRVLPGQKTAKEAKRSLRWAAKKLNGIIKRAKSNSRGLQSDEIFMEIQRRHREMVAESGERVRA